MSFCKLCSAARWLSVAALIFGISFLADVGTGRAHAQSDSVEFLNGTKLDGKVKAIRPADRQFEFVTQIGPRTIEKTYSFSEVHAVTLGGKRHVLTAMPSGPSEETNGRPERSRAEVRQIIDAAGKTLPSWFAEAPTDYPASLDMSWPEKAEGKWNNQKNVGQYIWDVINPNPDRWKSGIKLVQQIMESHQDDKSLLNRDQRTLARMYFELVQDYPRAAYWLEQARVTGREGEGVKLAECYWQLGNREMAMEVLTQPILPLAGIKLLGELGEVDMALRLAKAYEGSQAENDARILAADVLRTENRLDEAIAMYEKVLHSDFYRNAEYEQRFKGRAQDSIDAIRLFDKADVKSVADGRYRGSSVGYNGDVEVEVSVASGRLESVAVVKHREKQFYSALEDTPRQIVQRQSIRDIDGFSGATITSSAIVSATAKALAKGNP